MMNSSLKNRRTLIIITNGMLFLVAASFTVFKIYQLGAGNFPYPAISVCILTFIIGIYLFSGGDLAISETATFTVLIAGYTAATANTGGFVGASSTLAPIVPMLAILWFGSRSGWKFLALIIFIMSTLLAMELDGKLQPSQLSQNAISISHFMSAVATCIICTWMAWAFAVRKDADINQNLEKASIDHLTGLANRRALDLAILREAGRAKRDKRCLSLLLVDVDHFKRFNDNNGHQAGDKCLIKVAKVMQSIAMRPSDVVARYGGEEFAILLPDTSATGASAVAEKIRIATVDSEILYDDTSKDRLSLTLGVVSIEGSQIRSVSDLVSTADSALYWGKTNGRNQVVLKTVETIDQTENGYI